ncbi:MAG: aspartate aminotransferase family protein [Chloroflexi bacterium]|nr:aspartate aminotransferase family protein [Chloroflexota bacterium]
MTNNNSNQKQDNLLNIAKNVLPGGTLGNPAPKNLVIDKGLGSHIWDIAGNEYIDYLLGSGPMLLGHSNPEIVEAVKSQVEKGSTFFALNENAILLADEIVKAVPCADQVRFVSSGTEATFFALRAVRAFRKRDKILKFEGGYHGMHDYANMSLAPKKLIDLPKGLPDSPGIPESVIDEVLVAPFNDLEFTTQLIEKHHDGLAGVIVEPLQRVIQPIDGFLQGLRDITKHYDIPLIFDEIVTGFRLAYGGGQEYYGITPDLATYGKVIAGGHPLAAIAGKEYIMNHFNPNVVSPENAIMQVGTLSGNPVAAAAGLASLEILKEPNFYKDLFNKGERLQKALEDTFNELKPETPVKVPGEPPCFDLYFCDSEIINYRSTFNADKIKLLKFNSLLLERGIFKGDSKYYISSTLTENDIAQTINAFHEAVELLDK